MTWLILGVVFYVAGWIACIYFMNPRAPFEGALAVVTGVIWPLWAVGWLVSQ